MQAPPVETSAQEKHEVRIIRRYNASPDTVFEALVNPAAIAKWFGPNDEMAIEATVDAVEGGEYRIVMTHQAGNEYTVGGRFTKIDRPRYLEYTWKWESDEAMSGLPETTVSYSLTAIDGGTELTFLHQGFPVPEAAQGHNVGWNGSMWRLERLFGGSGLHHAGITLALNRKMYKNALSGIAEADSKTRLSDAANHLLWIAGHLASTRAIIAKLVGSEIEDEMAAFSKSLDESVSYPTLEEAKDFFVKASGEIHKRLPVVSDEQLRAPAPMQFPIADTTLSGAIAFLVQHESYHIGQMGLLRKMLGHEATSYA